MTLEQATVFHCPGRLPRSDHSLSCGSSGLRAGCSSLRPGGGSHRLKDINPPLAATNLFTVSTAWGVAIRLLIRRLSSDKATALALIACPHTSVEYYAIGSFLALALTRLNLEGEVGTANLLL